MEKFFISFPHIAEDLFGSLDSGTLENCSQVCQSWKKYLEGKIFFWTKLTNGHPGWDRLIAEKNFELLSTLKTTFLVMKVDPSISDLGIHPIFCAIHMGDIEIFKKLKSLDPNLSKLKIATKWMESICEISPIHYAAKLGRHQIVNFLLKITIEEEISDISLTPMHYAAGEGHLETVRLFLDNIEGDRNPKNKFGTTPLHLAARYGHLKTVRLLLNNIEGDKNPKSNFGYTVLHYAAGEGHLETVRLLLDNIEGDRNPESKPGCTPLHLAARNGHLETVRLLLNNIEGDKNPKSKYEYTPLHYAAREGHLEIVRLFLDNIEGLEH